MDTRTITLEADAYERLCAAMLPGETLSAAVRRIVPEQKRAPTGRELLEYYRYGGSGVSEEVLDGIEAAHEEQRLRDSR